MELSDPITEVPGIGNKYALLLQNLNIKTVEDLLWHVPFRYEDYTQISKISELMANNPATVIGEITKIDNIFTGRFKKLTRAVLEDETGKIEIIWFNQHYIKKSLPVGTILSVSGQLNPKEKRPQFVSPEWEIVKEGVLLHTAGLVPVYNTTEGISTKWLRAKIKQVLQNIYFDNIIPETILAKNDLIDKQDAMQNIHFPTDFDQTKIARDTLAFEELFLLHLNGLKLQKEWQKKKNGHKISLKKDTQTRFINSLPFKLTNSQLQVIEEILNDLDNEDPMNRLLQGDVGSGKTVVAAIGILACFESEFSSIFMAPTQILAEQHYKTLKNTLRETDIQIIIATSENSKDIKELELKDKDKYIVIGTHAILHNLEKFTNIGLIIIDEQHKFGVAQRSKIIDHYTDELTPNLLTMTATPIPRTLALTFYGGLNLSVITEMPKERKKVKTWVIDDKKRSSAYEWIKKEITTQKNQAFIVCPFIEESTVETLQNVKAAQAEYEKLVKVFSEYKLGLLHGKLKNDEKDLIIKAFHAGEIDILVSTPVIEVGIDIPNANIILIETPERFGLASLHQLRGRVGRGTKQGYCILLPSTDDQGAIHRLKYMEKIHHGNELSEIDLKLRGPGNMFGTEQHGFLNTRVADLTDYELISKTKSAAVEVLDNLQNYPKITQKLSQMDYISQN